MPTGEVVERGSGRPLAGVMISDGLVVTRTASDGSFSFAERPDAEFVFVTVPSSHVALESGWFARVGPTPAAGWRFELEPRPDGASDRCTFVQVTDLHVSVDEGARLRPMIEAGVVAPPGVQVTGEVSGAELRADLKLIVERVRPDFIAATGDHADYGQHEELEAYRDAVTGLGVPVASVPGNHDHLSVLSRAAIEAFFSTWRQEDDPDLSPGEAFQRSVFGGDWRRPDSGRAPWRDVIGPLYFSFDWGGVHFVAYDGEGLRRYGDDYPQDEWLVNDLAALALDTPVVVLTHFPEAVDFYEARFSDVRLLASLSGHWHGVRVWHDADAHHWTSSTLGFGGIDFTPRGYRVVEVDAAGARSRWEPVEEPSAAASRVTGAAAVANGRVVVATEAPDVTGAIATLDRWSHPLPSAARGGVTVAGGTVFALSITGALMALDEETGTARWWHRPVHASERWCLGSPVVADGRVYIGSARGVWAYEADDGAPIWHTALAPSDWTASWSGVAVVDGTVAIGAANDDLHLAALDSLTGEVRWKHAGRDIAGVSAAPVIVDDLVLSARIPGWLAAYALDDGTLRWESPLDEAWPVALTAHDGTAFVRTPDGTITAHAVETGDRRWTCALGPGPRSARPYSRTVGGSRAPLAVAGDHLWTSTFDELVGIDLMDGEVVSRTLAGSELATVVAEGDGAVAISVDAEVVRPDRS